MTDQIQPDFQETDSGFIRRSVSLYPIQDSVVMAYAKDSGLENYSAALRMIINQWLRYEQARLASAGHSAPAA